VILCFWRRPEPHAGFKGAVGFARCLAGIARKSIGWNWFFVFGLPPDVLGSELRADMPTISQLIRKPRQPKTYREKARHLQASPQRRGV
jgi:hypothetical protein